MHVAKRTVSLVFVSLLMLGAARNAAADAKEAMEQLKALHQSAASAYQDGDFEKTKSQLQEAITVAKENGLSSNRMMAQVYILFGVLKINEHKDTEAGVRYFAKAIDISPAVKIPPTMATKAVKAAFAKAENVDPSTIGDLAETEAAPAAKKPSKKDAAKEAAAAAAEAKEQEKQEKQDKAEKAAGTAAEKKQQEADRKQAETERKQAESERKQAATERRKTDAESTKLVEDLAQARVSESQAKVERDKLKTQLGEAKGSLAQLEKEKAAKDKQIADANAKIQQLEKEKADRDAKLGPAGAKIAQLEKDKAEKDKQLAALTASDKKERDAKEALLKEKAERDRQLGEAKARIAQLEKDKADRDKQIAALSASDKKEREAREKLEKTMAEVAARERERHSKEIEDQKEKEKLVEGGELPGHIREPVTCDLPDEVPAGEDLYVHCVPQPGVGAKMLAFYYRSAGMALYNAVTLERSRKGWYVTTIPGGRVSGRLIHYYVEARDAKEKVAASNGKPTSPNVITIRPAGLTKARSRK